MKIYSKYFRTKFLIFYYSFTLFYTSAIYPQNETTEINFFPLQNGNYWEYSDYTLYGYEYIGLMVMGDTLMPNGKTYKIIGEEFNFLGLRPEYFIRMDSSAIYRYWWDLTCIDSEFVWFDFNVPDSTLWKVCRDWGGYCGNAMGIGGTFYDNNYWHFFQKTLLTKLFDEVYIDSSDTVWNPCGATDYYISEDIGIIRQKWWDWGDFWLSGAIINGLKYGTIVSVQDEYYLNPQDIGIYAYPNPFNSAVSLEISLNSDGHTVLSIYNILGEQVDNLFDGWLNSGIHKFTYQANLLSGGIYNVVLSQGSNRKVKKIVLLK